MDVILIAMPWASVTYPSIQLGILKSLLDRSQISCASMSLNLSFFEYLAAQRDAEPMSLEQYHYIGEATGLGLGEWIFASAAGSFSDAPRDDAYQEFARRQNPTRGVLEIAERSRELVPAFLDSCAEKILAAHPRVVGFTSTFSQTFPSLALAKRLKEQAPDLRVVFGGANVDGPMGKTLHALYPCIDVVVRGESERVAPRLFRELIDGDGISKQPGLCIRENGEVTAVVDIASGGVAMDETPLPDYDEYFQRRANSPVSDDIDAGGITYESARGCWWGAKHHCTFCGLNGATMNFRSKPAERVFDELHTLSKRYRNLHFIVVDNIIDMKHVKELLPMLRESDIDFSFYYETKANLKKHEMRLLRDAGVRMIQPGIESLSTPILKLMRKGTTALQNVRFLKWCAEMGITPDWNLLYGFPGEAPEEYSRMADVMLSLTHFTPPSSVHPICINRFSPYHKTPEEFGIRIRGPGFVQVVDRRTNGKGGTYTLDGVAGEAYLACDRGATPRKVWNGLSREFQSGVTQGDVRDFLQQMVNQRLVFEENDHYLSLAIPDGERLDEDDHLVADTPRGERTATVKPFPTPIA